MRAHPKWSLLLILAVALPCLAGESAKNLIPEDEPGPPAYMRLEVSGPRGITDLTWVAIPVYRDLDGIPKDFNLLDFLDVSTPARRAHAWSVPLRVRGYTIRSADTPFPGPPVLLRLENRTDTDMSILFVSWEEFREEVEDDHAIYIDELLAMDSLMVGVADEYTETTRSNPLQHEIDTFGTVTAGQLTGSTFRVHYSLGAESPFTVTRISFD